MSKARCVVKLLAERRTGYITGRLNGIMTDWPDGYMSSWLNDCMTDRMDELNEWFIHADGLKELSLL